MPLEHILRAMQAQADAEIAQITRTADEEIAQLIAEAEAQAAAIRARHHARVEPLLAQQAANLQNQAELDARRALAEAREQLLNEAFAQAQARLAQIRQSHDYPAILRALVRQAIHALGNDLASSSEQQLVVHVDPADVALACTVFNELGVSCEIVPQTMPLGGVEIATRDERIVITNTLAARLERARQYLRGTIAQMLVGDQESNQEWMTSTAMPTPA